MIWRLATAIAGLALLAGCNQEEPFIRIDLLCPPGYRYVTPVIEYPVVNLPLALRQSNWRGSRGEGSCVHASMISLLRWQGRYEMADYWRDHYGNGEYADRFAERLDREGIRFAYTAQENDVSFLEWACSTRRGCNVTVRGGAHMVTLVHFDSENAGILDNNDIVTFKWLTREEFLDDWFSSGSWAVTPVYSPAPPLPAR